MRTGLTGFEPAASGVTDRHSNQLSYSPLLHKPGKCKPAGSPIQAPRHPNTGLYVGSAPSIWLT